VYPMDMCTKIDYYLANDQERARIAKNAHNKVLNQPIERNVEILINEILMEMYHKKYKGNVFSKLGNLCKHLFRK
ncbi:MAG: glycosyltransferase family 1 protein, partial [Pseudobutyrivibrio sp.]|nr:glycosyltransferase family 1 protein [Pseudobutyrivibrio sp.]